MSDGGKGSGRRPQAVSDEQIADNWSNIFGPSPLERKRREQALDEVIRISEELGLYELEFQETEEPVTGTTGSDNIR